MRKGDARKAAIIDTAQRLFYTKGYENTSIQDVLDELHLSKGGFYHHFESKMALLEAISEKLVEESYSDCVEQLKTIDDISARLSMIFELSTFLGQPSMKFKVIMLSVAYKERNVMLREQMKAASTALMRGLLKNELDMGQSKKLLQNRFPRVNDVILLNICHSLADEISNCIVKKQDSVTRAAEITMLINAYTYCIETQLALPQGSLKLVKSAACGELMNAYDEADRSSADNAETVTY